MKKIKGIVFVLGLMFLFIGCGSGGGNSGNEKNASIPPNNGMFPTP